MLKKNELNSIQDNVDYFNGNQECNSYNSEFSDQVRTSELVLSLNLKGPYLGRLLFAYNSVPYLTRLKRKDQEKYLWQF